MATFESDIIKGFSFENHGGELVAIFEKHAGVPGEQPRFTLPELEEHLDDLMEMGVYGDVTAVALQHMRKLSGLNEKTDSRRQIKP